MKKVFIKYNPYKLETEITVDGKALAENSRLGEKALPGSRLQEWVEELPELLVEEYNDKDFDILFHGTKLDFDDLTEVFTKAHNDGLVKAVKLDRKPAKETSEKEALIDKVFAKIQEGPFEDLRSPEIRSAFENAKSSDFEVCVVATMSAGKSTLINSLIRTKLMPSKAEACTAIITRIKDNDGDGWSADVYNKEDRLIESYKDLTPAIMDRLNSDENVSMIAATGDIPFVTADDVALVLIDTPGPNNSRDPSHAAVQSNFLGKSSKSLVLYIMEATFGSGDDNSLLNRVAASMSVGGKQSKDRFIFVVNKMDNMKREDGDISQTLGRVRDYLNEHEIEKPNLFPVAALPALNIRLIQSGSVIDEEEREETDYKVKKLNRNENLHLEKHASLPIGLKEKINNELDDYKEKGDANNEALIHTGIPSVEAAIRQYVQKYAKTAKIKNIVDTFIHSLDDAECMAKTEHELAKNVEANAEIVKRIDDMKRKIDDMEAAKQFKGAVDRAVAKVTGEAKQASNNIIQQFQADITKKIDSYSGFEIETDKVEDVVKELERFAKRLEPDFKDDMEDLIRNNLIKTGNALLDEYKKKLASLTDFTSDLKISIDPLRMISGNVVSADNIVIKNMTREKKVEDGEEWVKNTDKKWYKPWTWFQESGYYRTKYKTVTYVSGNELAQTFLQPIQEGLYDNGDAACEYALNQATKIANDFSWEFKRLDDMVKSKLAELKNYATNRDKAEERIRETQAKKDWLNEIKREVESILEI